MLCGRGQSQSELVLVELDEPLSPELPLLELLSDELPLEPLSDELLLELLSDELLSEDDDASLPRFVELPWSFL